MKRSAAFLVVVAFWMSGPAQSALLLSARSSGTVHVNLHQRSVDASALAQAKARANLRAARSTRHASSATTTAANGGVYDEHNVTGLLGDTSVTPSDSTGDVGPYTPPNGLQSGRWVEMANSSGQVYGQSPVPLYQLTHLSQTDCIFDPQIMWDQGWKHWVFVVAAQKSSVAGQCSDEKHANITDDLLIYGVSKTSDPNLTPPAPYPSTADRWCVYTIDTGSKLHDFPKLGHDNNFLIIGTNVYSNYGQGAFVSSAIWAIRKFNPVFGNLCAASGARSMFGGSASSVLKNSDGSTTFTPVPAETTDSYGAGYIVSAVNPGVGTATKLMLWHIGYNAGSPVLNRDGMITVPGYQVPPSVPQPSTGVQPCDTTGDCLDSGDARLTQAIARYDPDAGRETIWTQHTVGDPHVNDLSMERWYELVPGSSVPRQTGTVSDPSLYIFNGAISPSRAGNEAAMFYNTGSSASFVSYRAKTRSHVTPLGALTGDIVLATSTQSDADFSCGMNDTPKTGTPCRWGDYAAARPDPVNANVVWGFGMWMYNAERWTTQVAAVTPGCSTLQLTQSPSVGTQITYTAHDATGCSDPRYQFWMRDPTLKETLKRGFGTSDTWTWDTAGYPPGMYAVRAGATQNGDSMSNWEAASMWLGFLIPRCQVQSLSPSYPNQPAGATINFAATSMAECDFPTYAYWYQVAGGKWILGRPYSSDPNWDFNTAGFKPGLYEIQVWEHRTGDPSSTYENLTVTPLTLTGCDSADLSPSPVSQPAGSTVAFTASSSGGCPNPVYEYWVLAPGGKWTIKRAFSADPTWNWDTTGLKPGTYTVHSWANQQGAYTGLLEATGSSTVTLTGCTSATLAPASGSVRVGTPVNFTAGSAGCPNPLYEYWLQDTQGVWHRMTGFGGNTWTWNNAGWGKGVYHVHVWANQAGAYTGALEAVANSTFTLI